MSFKSNVRIRVFGNGFINYYQGVEIKKIIDIDDQSRRNLWKNGQTLVLSFEETSSSSVIDFKNKIIYYKSKFRLGLQFKQNRFIKIGGIHYEVVNGLVPRDILARAKNNEEARNIETQTYKTYVEISNGDLNDFLDNGLLDLDYRNFSKVQKIDLHIKEKNNVLSKKLTSFDIIYNPSHCKIRNTTLNKKLYNSIQKTFSNKGRSTLRYGRGKSLEVNNINHYRHYLISLGDEKIVKNKDEWVSSTNINSFEYPKIWNQIALPMSYYLKVRKNPEAKLEIESYALVQFIKIDHETNQIKPINNLEAYDGAVALIYQDHNDSGYVTLISPDKVKWIMHDKNRYLPVQFMEPTKKDEVNKVNVIVRDNPYPNYTLLRPFSEKIGIVVYQWMPDHNEWKMEHFYPPKDTEVREITYNANKDIWSVQRIDLWGAIQKPYSFVPSVNGHFMVECTHAERHSIVQARNIDKVKDSPVMLDSSVPLVKLVPESKRERVNWQTSKVIFFQQSTVGAVSGKRAQLIEINVKTKKPVKIFSSENRGANILLDGNKFRNGAYVIAFGPKTARFDIAPALRPETTQPKVDFREAHTILATGFMPKTTSWEYQSNPFPSLFNY